MTQKDQLKDALWRSLSQLLPDLKFDITLKGCIKSVAENHVYTVLVDGHNYQIKSALDITFALNENVWVTVPQGNYSNMYICGRRR